MIVRRQLMRHPDSLRTAIERIEVEVSRNEPLLMLRYLVTGTIADLRLPPESQPVRAEGLWEHSCFEAFIGTEGNYLELNFAPSRAWAAYRFEGWRIGKRNAGIAPPDIVTARRADRFELDAEVRIDRWEGPLGLSAVIEERNGRLSYWALAHPPGKPDFHHEDCFALQLPAAERS